MTETTSPLPSFEKPPVIETVLGVFFRPFRKLNCVQQGIYWNEVLRPDFPTYELRPPIEETVERFASDSSLLQAGIRWQVSSEPETPRLWAQSPSNEHILQVQRNAILANWLRRGQYLPFAERLTDFGKRLNQFGDFANRAQFDQELAPSSFTVTYINQIPVESHETWASCAARTLKCFSNPATDWLPDVDRGLLQFSFGFASAPGRLHVVAIPAQAEEGSGLVVRLELTARLMASKETPPLADISKSLQIAHDWVVRGFAALTRPEMHRAWGRTQ